MKRLVALLVLGVGVACAAATAAGRPPAVIAPQVSIAGVRVGGLTSEPARAKVRAAFARPLTFVHEGGSWTMDPYVLGGAPAVDRAIAKALTAAPRVRIQLPVSVATPAVRRYVASLERRFSYPAKDAELVGLVGLRPSLSEPEAGLRVRKGVMARTIARALRFGWRGPFRLATETVEPAVTAENFGPVVVIHRASKQLNLYDGERPWRRIPVATGQKRYPTPLGQFSILDMQRNPWWRPPDSDWAKGLKPIPPGPGNPLGTRWMGISAPGVGMHGTPDARSIGYSASHGCIRMLVSDAEWLFEQVHIGTPVFIVDA